MDQLTSILQNSPQNGSTEVAERGTLPASEHRGHEPSVTSERQVPHRVHATVHAKQTPALRPHSDRTGAQSQLDQLTVPHQPVLPCGKRGEPLIDGGFAGLIPHIGTKTASPPDSPPQCPPFAGAPSRVRGRRARLDRVRAGCRSTTYWSLGRASRASVPL